MLVDAHAHLNDAKYGDDVVGIVNNYRKCGVGLVVNSGFDYKSSVAAKKLAEEYDDMYFCAGVHPDDAKTVTDGILADLYDLAKDGKCLAIGEIGFDFYWNKSTEAEQEKAFLSQMKLADELGLPFVVHSRNAANKTYAFIKEHIALINNGFLLHCFSESAEMARLFKDLGAYFSFGGVITFKNAKKDEIIRTVGKDRILTETDCPYLSPEPFRGQINEPSRIPYILAKMAESLGLSAEETEKAVESNAKRFFRL